MESPSILVVDDEENFLLLLKTALSSGGYRVTTAHDGIEALAYIERETFRVAILDIKMHPMGGVEVLEEIKSRSPSTHVIMATGYPTGDNRNECMERGAVGYLAKPLNLVELKALLARLAADNVTLGSASGSMDKKRILVVEDHPINRKLFVLLLDGLGYDIIEAGSGLEAIDQARAVRPDLIFMDLSMRGISGDEATMRLKADPATKDIPVILCTSFEPESELVVRALSAGAAEVLHKPISATTFKEVTHRYFSSE